MLDRDLEQPVELPTLGEMLWDDINVREAFKEQILNPILEEYLEDGMTDTSKVEAMVFIEYFEAFAYSYWHEKMIEQAETLAL